MACFRASSVRSPPPVADPGISGPSALLSLLTRARESIDGESMERSELRVYGITDALFFGVGTGRVVGVMHRNRGRVHSIQKTFLPFHQDGKGKRHVRLSHTASRKRHTRKGEVRMMPTSEPDVWRVQGWEVAKGYPWKGTRDQCRAKEHT